MCRRSSARQRARTRPGVEISSLVFTVFFIGNLPWLGFRNNASLTRRSRVHPSMLRAGRGRGCESPFIVFVGDGQVKGPGPAMSPQTPVIESKEWLGLKRFLSMAVSRLRPLRLRLVGALRGESDESFPVSVLRNRFRPLPARPLDLCPNLRSRE